MCTWHSQKEQNIFAFNAFKVNVFIFSLVKSIQQVKIHIQYDIFWLLSVQMGIILQIHPIFDPGRGVLKFAVFQALPKLEI